MTMNGLLNVYKERGYTSHDVVAIMRRILKMKKIGHGGTLDPDAEGVLVVLVGKATKLSETVMAGKKVYKAGLKLGVVTDTQDMTGQVLSQKPAIVSETDLKTALKAFEGTIKQLPPMYSAIKIDGQKLYNIARAGKSVNRTPRTVHIYDLKLIRFDPPDSATIEVTCSKGTYIRTLCHDIGGWLGCGGAMNSLIRLQSGYFDVSSAHTIDQLEKLVAANDLSSVLQPVDSVYLKAGMNKAHILPGAYSNALNGNTLTITQTDFDPDASNQMQKVLLYGQNNQFVGLYHLNHGYFKPDQLFFIS